MRLIDADVLKAQWEGISPKAMLHPESVINTIDRAPSANAWKDWNAGEKPEDETKIVVLIKSDGAYEPYTGWVSDLTDFGGAYVVNTDDDYDLDLGKNIRFWMPVPDPPDGDREY